MPEVDGRVTYCLPGEVVRDRVDLQPVSVEDLKPRRQIHRVFICPLQIEVITGRRNLEPVVAPRGGEPSDLLER